MEKLNTKTEKVRQVIESKGWEMLSDQYNGYKEKISVKCPNGHVQNKTFQSIKNNKKCLKCFHKSGKAGKKTHDYEDVKKYIESCGYELLSKEYKRQSDLLDMVCKNNHHCAISFKKFKQNRRCRHCDPSKKKDYEDVKKYIESCGYELLSKEYVNSTGKLLIKCKNNHVVSKSWSSFYSKPACGECRNTYKNMTKKEYADMYNKSDKGIYNRYRNECNRRNRKKRNINMLLKFEEFSKIINKECFYCGTSNCRGVDRVDSSESYTLENCVPCCKICNQMKSDMKKDDFLEHVKNISNRFADV